MQAKRTANAKVGLGRRGEELAATALTCQGYRIVERNWRCATGEVDLVARRGDRWYFFEVRTRRGDECGTPEESLVEAKRERMLQVALTYLAEHECDPYNVDWYVGLVAVEMDRAGRLLRVEVYESIE